MNFAIYRIIHHALCHIELRQIYEWKILNENEKNGSDSLVEMQSNLIKYQI